MSPAPSRSTRPPRRTGRSRTLPRQARPSAALNSIEEGGYIRQAKKLADLRQRSKRLEATQLRIHTSVGRQERKDAAARIVRPLRTSLVRRLQSWRRHGDGDVVHPRLLCPPTRSWQPLFTPVAHGQIRAAEQDRHGAAYAACARPTPDMHPLNCMPNTTRSVPLPASSSANAPRSAPKRTAGLILPACGATEQVRGWRGVTDAVHKKGGLMYAQLWHTGAMSHPDFFDGALPMSASDVNPEQESVTPSGRKPTVAPRPMSKR